MKKLGIVAAGGPAPGVNSAIGAATIRRARLSGVEVSSRANPTRTPQHFQRTVDPLQRLGLERRERSRNPSIRGRNAAQ
jgi:6-phosphofructokinase 1